MLPQIIVVLGVVELTNQLLEKVVLPLRGMVGKKEVECAHVSLALTPEELERIVQSDVGSLFKSAANRAALLEKVND